VASTPAPVGFILPTFPQEEPIGRTFTELGPRAAAAEAAGAASLWACDHLYWPGPSVECLTALTVAAAATTTALVGTGVLQLPLRDVAPVAKAVASVQGLSGGRVVLGLGTGRHRGEYEAAGRDFSGRGAALDEGIARLQAEWKSGPEPYEQRPAPAPVPLWFGGNGGRPRRRVVRHGAGWMPLFLSPDRLRAEVDALRRDLHAAGRSPAEVVVAPVIPVAVGAAPDRGRWLASLLGLAEDQATDLVHTGSAEEVAHTLAAYEQAGADHLILLVADDDPVQHLASITAARV
jgi:alkanesulfonate monooxygenase SsuD/methylene tetrahydromethanopterin reductase-like flavin-dependent oxidoreductase (luciferase family)